jgi:hypothetical protein
LESEEQLGITADNPGKAEELWSVI